MNKSKYQKLTESIHTPAGLSERVLAAAETQPAPPRTAPYPGGHAKRHLWRAAVCAACALVLVVGTWSVYPGTGSGTDEDSAPVTALPTFSFGLTAYAADTGESMPPNANGGLAFRAGGEGSWSERDGYYTGCMFQVTGENIVSVSLSIDRGGLYRYQVHTDLTEEEIAGYRQAMAEGTLTVAAISQAEDGTWYMPEMTALGADAAEAYDPEASYGFWVPGADADAWGEDLRAASHESIDFLDGAHLKVTVTFADDTEQTRTYTLSTGRLRFVQDGDSPGGSLLPQLAGDNEPYVYGVYAESETEGCWLEWPVQDSRTISLSNPYGERENGTFHTGVDIPAEQGAVILAAADGTVTKIGFDPELGNYVVLDHGGGLETLYGQCRDILDGLEEGTAVAAGEMIGAVGSTGMATGPHLHFEVRQDGKVQNPVAYFRSDVRDTLRMA